MKIKNLSVNKLWYFFKPHKTRLLALLVFMFISGMLEAINLAALYPVINYGLGLNASNFIMVFFGRIITLIYPANQFLGSSILLMALTVLSLFARAVYYLFANRLSTDITGYMEKEIIDKYISADYGFFVQNQQGRLIHTGTVATREASAATLSAIRLMYDALNAAFFLYLLLSLTWRGTIVLASVSITYAIFVKRVMEKIIYKSAAIAIEEDSKKNVILNELINGIKAIKIFMSSDSWKDKYMDAVNKSKENKFKMLMGRVIPESFIKFMLLCL